jgi:hypothetical protein
MSQRGKRGVFRTRVRPLLGAEEFLEGEMNDFVLARLVILLIYPFHV